VTFAERDPALRQFERDGVVACLVMAAAAVVVQRGRLDGAVGVVAGGLLMAVSYRAIKGAADLVVGLVPPGDAGDRPTRGEGDASDEDGAPAPRGPGAVVGPRRRAALAVKFLARYALLAVGAYVMLMRFRLHPIGLLVGATTPFVSAVVQVARSWRASSRRDNP
jgi:hypothetical protein